MRLSKSNKFVLLLVSLFFVALTGCDKAGNLPLNQTQVCDVSSYEPATQCPVGQKIAFFPSSWGNEQLPLLFVALNCDMRYSVALTNGGVVCIHAPIKDADAKTDSQK